MLLGLIQFLRGQHLLEGHGEAPDVEKLKAPAFLGLSLEKTIYLGGLLMVVVCWQLVQYQHLVGGLLGAFAAVISIIIIGYSLTKCSSALFTSVSAKTSSRVRRHQAHQSAWKKTTMPQNYSLLSTCVPDLALPACYYRTCWDWRSTPTFDRVFARFVCWTSSGPATCTIRNPNTFRRPT